MAKKQIFKINNNQAGAYASAKTFLRGWYMKTKMMGLISKMLLANPDVSSDLVTSTMPFNDVIKTLVDETIKEYPVASLYIFELYEAATFILGKGVFDSFHFIRQALCMASVEQSKIKVSKNIPYLIYVLIGGEYDHNSLPDMLADIELYKPAYWFVKVIIDDGQEFII